MDAIRFRFGQTKQLLVILAVRSTTEILLRAARSPAHSEMGSELAVRYAKPKNETATARLIDNYYMALCWLAVRRSVTLHVLRTFNADVSMNTDTPADSQLPTLKAIAQLISFFFLPLILSAYRKVHNSQRQNQCCWLRSCSFATSMKSNE